jgi:hypothetical protein
MSIRALSRLLGRSTIDPAVAKAYESGRLNEILAEYDFTPETRSALEAIEASTFQEFASLALARVRSIESESLASIAPDPRQGLGADAVIGDEEQAA